MTYTRGIPDAAQSPAVQQSPLQTNTNLVDDYFGVDHNAFSAAADQGEHKQITYTAPLAVAPAPAGTKAALYTETIAGQTQLVYKNATNTYQLTPPGLAVFTPLAQARIRNQGGWQAFNSTGVVAVTNTGPGLFTLELTSAVNQNTRVLVTGNLANTTPSNIQNTGIIGTVSGFFSGPSRISLIFVTATGTPANPPSGGFTILVW